MSEPFDVYQYAVYLGRRWRFFIIACGSAALLVLAGSFLLRKQYTATVSIVIEPGISVTSNVVSPVYLESLKMYETFAASDATFRQALEHFHLQVNDSSPETLKKKILRVVKIRDTRILQISATLPNPQQALEFARYIADRTMRLNRSVTNSVGEDALAAAEKEALTAKKALDAAESDWIKLPERGSIDALREELFSLADLKAQLHRDSLAAAVEVSTLREGSESREGGLTAAEAKAALLSKQAASADQEFERKSHYLSKAIADHDLLEERVESLRKIYENTEIRVHDLRATTGMNNDRLKMIDNGAVPVRPSFPRRMESIEAAVILAFVVSLVFLSISFTSRRAVSETSARYRFTP